MAEAPPPQLAQSYRITSFSESPLPLLPYPKLNRQRPPDSSSCSSPLAQSPGKLAGLFRVSDHNHGA